MRKEGRFVVVVAFGHGGNGREGRGRRVRINGGSPVWQ